MRSGESENPDPVFPEIWKQTTRAIIVSRDFVYYTESLLRVGLKLSPSLLRVGMKLSGPDLLQTAEPFYILYIIEDIY
jgi:hypothetical protein